MSDWLRKGADVNVPLVARALKQDEARARVAFVGDVGFSSGIWVGVVFDMPVGNSDGSRGGTRYFTCKANHGLFLKPSVLRPLTGSVDTKKKTKKKKKKQKSKPAMYDKYSDSDSGDNLSNPPSPPHGAPNDHLDFDYGGPGNASDQDEYSDEYDAAPKKSQSRRKKHLGGSKDNASQDSSGSSTISPVGSQKAGSNGSAKGKAMSNAQLQAMKNLAHLFKDPAQKATFSQAIRKAGVSSPGKKSRKAGKSRLPIRKGSKLNSGGGGGGGGDNSADSSSHAEDEDRCPYCREWVDKEDLDSGLHACDELQSALGDEDYQGSRLMKSTAASRKKTIDQKDEDSRRARAREQRRRDRAQSLGNIADDSRLLRHTAASVSKTAAEREAEKLRVQEYKEQQEQRARDLRAQRERQRQKGLKMLDTDDDDMTRCNICKRMIPGYRSEAHFSKCLQRQKKRQEQKANAPSTLANELMAEEWLCFESHDLPDHFLRFFKKKNYYCRIANVETPNALKAATFRVVPGLVNGPVVSLESQMYPGHYLRLAHGQVRLEPIQANKRNWRRDATWRVRPALLKSAQPDHYSFESVSKTGYYMHHKVKQIYVSKASHNENDPFRKSACFQATTPGYVSQYWEDDSDMDDESVTSYRGALSDAGSVHGSDDESVDQSVVYSDDDMSSLGPQQEY